ncbi:MAG: bifunctional 4-hydroxy-2-oxoglutarate aldolase/2-dehydro-3-deoxy-phosphogluconate aldolase [Syntrophobacteraceae bacterium]|jgi:2-dehydro-3-deoxyphosphogluconate aldolase/(4S)-4-hydroxy-2-oxoglutarate aldolase
MKLHIPVIGILRGVSLDFFGNVMSAAFDAGLQALEVTFNTDRAEEIIAQNRPHVSAGKFLGVGTIRNLDEARRAVDSGAMFLVTPNVDAAVIEYAVSQDIPVIVGAMTPTEVYTAWSAGAAMVKVFPCTVLGPQHIRDLLGPFDAIPLVAVGGVDSSNVNAYFEAGAAAVGVGAALFGHQALADRKPRRIFHNVTQFLSLIRQ